MRKIGWGVVSIVLLSAQLNLAQAAPAGAVLMSAEPIDTTGNFEPALKKAGHKAFEKRPDGQWAIYFVAFLRKAAGAEQVNVVFYDAAIKEHEPVNAFPIATQSSAKILSSNVTFGEDQGFKAGHTYSLLITRLIGGKEEVYAKAMVSLR